jgi:hypothetical protein
MRRAAKGGCQLSSMGDEKRGSSLADMVKAKGMENGTSTRGMERREQAQGWGRRAGEREATRETLPQAENECGKRV